VKVIEGWLRTDKITRECDGACRWWSQSIVLIRRSRRWWPANPGLAPWVVSPAPRPAGGVMLIPPASTNAFVQPINDLETRRQFRALQAEGLARWALFALTSLIAVGFTVWLLRAERWMTALSLSLVIGGAVGNLVDRARFGAVVDFLDFSGSFPWIFNVAGRGNFSRRGVSAAGSVAGKPQPRS